jgi:hypothetical protein
MFHFEPRNSQNGSTVYMEIHAKVFLWSNFLPPSLGYGGEADDTESFLRFTRFILDARA